MKANNIIITFRPPLFIIMNGGGPLLFNTRVRIKSTATVLTAETEGLLDHEVYNGKAKEKAPETKEVSAA